MQKAKHLVNKDTPITGDNLDNEFNRVDTAEKMKESIEFKPIR